MRGNLHIRDRHKYRKYKYFATVLILSFSNNYPPKGRSFIHEYILILTSSMLQYVIIKNANILAAIVKILNCDFETQPPRRYSKYNIYMYDNFKFILQYDPLPLKT